MTSLALARDLRHALTKQGYSPHSCHANRGTRWMVLKRTICGLVLKELYCDLVLLANSELGEILSIDGKKFCDDRDSINMDYATKILFDEMGIDFTLKKLPMIGENE